MQEKITIIDLLLKTGLEKLDLNPANDSKKLKEDFHKIKNEIYKNFEVKKPFPSIELIERYNELMATGELPENLVFQKVLRKR